MSWPVSDGRAWTCCVVNDILGAKGLPLRTGAVVDAKLIAAPNSRGEPSHCPCFFEAKNFVLPGPAGANAQLIAVDGAVALNCCGMHGGPL